jgi:hypothetical protein
MDLHGVEDGEYAPRGNMQTLTGLIKGADRVLSY